MISRQTMRQLIQQIHENESEECATVLPIKGTPDDDAIQCVIEDGLNIREYKGFTFICDDDPPPNHFLDRIIADWQLYWD